MIPDPIARWRKAGFVGANRITLKRYVVGHDDNTGSAKVRDGQTLNRGVAADNSQTVGRCSGADPR